jgi:ubiquinone/menaquinone biosynthesis C-methylase UbiE
MSTHHDPSSAACSRIGRAQLSPQEIVQLNTYDFMTYLGKRVINPGGLYGRELVLGRLKLAPGDRVLEIGGGTGLAACYIAKRYRCHVTTIDIAPHSVEAAANRISREGLGDRVRSEVGDVNDLRFHEGSFDAVICQAVLMFVDQQQALSEIRRVLKPGGVFAGLEFSWRQDPSAHVREKTYAICGCQTLHFHPREGWCQQLRHAGFIRVKGDEHPFGLLSITGFLRDEGLMNSLYIAGKVLSCRASLARMSGIWSHFSRHSDYFSYAVFSGEKLNDI